MQHAVAVLVGVIPSGFSIPPVKELRLVPPGIPPGVPSQSLQRRPDIASAERQMAAANATIGVARAAFYPNVTLSATAGSEDNAFNLLSLPNSLWSVGAGAMLPLFEGGLRRAELERSWSQYAQTRDNYRATVLAAFQEVEDGLSLTLCRWFARWAADGPYKSYPPKIRRCRSARYNSGRRGGNR